MDPDALRCCMSFGFSEKQSDAFIGQCTILLSFFLFPCEIDILKSLLLESLLLACQMAMVSKLAQ
jgi:hypothetical protein